MDLWKKNTAKRSTRQSFLLCRVSDVGHTANILEPFGMVGAVLFAVCRPFVTRQRRPIHRSFFFAVCWRKRTAIVLIYRLFSLFAECILLGTRQSFQKKILILASQLFLLCAYNTCCSLVNFGICIYSFTIFNDLICLIKFLAIKLEVFWVVEYNEPKNDIQVQEVNVRTYAWKPK